MIMHAVAKTEARNIANQERGTLPVVYRSLPQQLQSELEAMGARAGFPAVLGVPDCPAGPAPWAAHAPARRRDGPRSRGSDAPGRRFLGRIRGRARALRWRSRRRGPFLCRRQAAAAAPR